MSRRIIVGVLAALLAGLLAVPAAPVGAASFSPVADTHVDANAPTANYGTKTYLRTDNSPVIRSYLRFDVQGVGGPTTAKLVFYAETASRLGIEVHEVNSTTWGETTTNNTNAPGVGDLIGSTGPFAAGTWLMVDVSSAITGNGLVSFALTTPSNTAIKVTSREGANKPQLVAPAPPKASHYLVSRNGGTYQAVSQPAGTTFTGTAKFVVEAAVADLENSSGGTVQFTAGTFDLGSQFFKFYDAADIVFVGAGMDATVIQNSSSAAADTEPFNFTGADRVVVRDLTVSAGGSVRSTSDALDFDQGNDVTVERVKVIASRGRGIIFDGKNDTWTALRNQVHDCVITGTASDGIELLASSDNTIEGCTITGVGGHGIQLAKASTSADQPNKKSNDNTVTGNTIDQAGQDGINLTSGDRNKVLGNTVTNSSDDTSGRDGIRLSASDSIACNDNQVSSNTATDTQSPKTQRYGLNISSSLCSRTVVGPGNSLGGNLTGPIRDAGTATIYR
jgi:parallel beta-helix repeat protein